ncbi:MAG: 50S ribosomal protein L24 [Polyangiaceae bacterium]|nr:50S ribosomal protein L24 [Polyangiaceae bacterium]
MSVARLQKGDKVIVISGKDKGKVGTVKRVLREDDKVIVEGVNLVKRHTKPNQRMQQGGIVEREQAMFACKVMLVDPKTGKATRVRTKIEANPKNGSENVPKNVKENQVTTKVRIAVKSGEEIPSPSRNAAS